MIVVVTTVIGLFVPKLREFIITSAEFYQSMMTYILTSTQRNRMTGQLRLLVDNVKRGPDVQRIHLVGYSFGSLVVLDTMFSHASAEPSPLPGVTSITTIGCPFDLIRLINPPYVMSRQPSFTTQDPPFWLNIYAPVDVLGSNFADSDTVQQPSVGFRVPADYATNTVAAGTGIANPGAPTPSVVVEPQRWPDKNLAWEPAIKKGIINFLMLKSLTTHSTYWTATKEDDSALAPVVSRITSGRWS